MISETMTTEQQSTQQSRNLTKYNNDVLSNLSPTCSPTCSPDVTPVSSQRKARVVESVQMSTFDDLLQAYDMLSIRSVHKSLLLHQQQQKSHKTLSKPQEDMSHDDDEMLSVNSSPLQTLSRQQENEPEKTQLQNDDDSSHLLRRKSLKRMSGGLNIFKDNNNSTTTKSTNEKTTVLGDSLNDLLLAYDSIHRGGSQQSKTTTIKNQRKSIPDLSPSTRAQLTMRHSMPSISLPFNSHSTSCHQHSSMNTNDDLKDNDSGDDGICDSSSFHEPSDTEEHS